MADISTYSGLQAVVADWLGRDDLTEQIPVFIRLAEKRMNRELRLRNMERRAETEVLKGQNSVPLPWRREPGNWDVFMEMRDLVWKDADGSVVRNLHYMPVDDYAAGRLPEAVPTQYTIVGRDLFLVPAPAANGTLRLTYYAEIPPLGDEQPDNEVLLNFPDLYLYGTLVESGPFTRSSAPLETWAEYYAAARQKAEANERRARFTSNLQMRPVRRVN